MKMINGDKGKFLVKQLANKEYKVIQLKQELFEKLFEDVNPSDYKVFDIQKDEYIKMKKGYNKMISVEDVEVLFRSPDSKPIIKSEPKVKKEKKSTKKSEKK